MHPRWFRRIGIRLSLWFVMMLCLSPGDPGMGVGGMMYEQIQKRGESEITAAARAQLLIDQQSYPEEALLSGIPVQMAVLWVWVWVSALVSVWVWVSALVSVQHTQ
jgi:hypothetical protein